MLHRGAGARKSMVAKVAKCVVVCDVVWQVVWPVAWLVLVRR
jgi:hypothetical protein